MSHPIELAVTMPDSSVRVVRSLLTWEQHNKKFAKSAKSGKGYLSVGLSLAPHRISGHNVCPNATAGCSSSCIFSSGLGFFPEVTAWRVAKTRAFYQHREEFVEKLDHEIGLAEIRAAKQGKRVACRLNVFSDLPWERQAPHLFVNHPGVRFYDYTKSCTRALQHARQELPANYHLTFSRSESNEEDCRAVLYAGGNVAVVFDRAAKGALPAKWRGFPVVDGDQHDLRFLDVPAEDPDGGRSVTSRQYARARTGLVIGLYAKGKGRDDETGFVINTKPAGGRRVALYSQPA